MKSIRSFAAVGVLAMLACGAGTAQEQKIEIVPVSYDGLKQEILKHRGKVVVVDFWATYCPPCMASFPKFIDMQTKHKDKGLVVISVSLDRVSDDPEEDRENIERANKFLNRVKSPLRNLLLDEPPDAWSKRFEFKSLPFYYVFDRQGRWIRYPAAGAADDKVDYVELENTVARLLGEK